MSTVLFQTIQFSMSKLNGFKYCHVSQTIQLNTVKGSNNSILHS